MDYDNWKCGYDEVEPDPPECDVCNERNETLENVAYHLKDMQGVIFNSRTTIPGDIIGCLQMACEELESALGEQVYYLPDPMTTEEEKDTLAENLFNDLKRMNEVLYGNK